jgi:hypothetical protein
MDVPLVTQEEFHRLGANVKIGFAKLESPLGLAIGDELGQSPDGDRDLLPLYRLATLATKPERNLDGINAEGQEIVTDFEDLGIQLREVKITSTQFHHAPLFENLQKKSSSVTTSMRQRAGRTPE